MADGNVSDDPRQVADGIKINLVGKRYGRLIVVSYAGKHRTRNSLWLCCCDCGVEVTRVDSQLKQPEIPSCGCYIRDRGREMLYRHGKSSHRFYAVWKSIMARCYNPNHHAWGGYGGRGITVHEKWHDFDSFVADIEPTYPGPGYSIDRVNGNGNYAPDNFRWATWVEQNNNRRDNIRLMFRGREMTRAEIARLTGVNYGSLTRRMRRTQESADEAVDALLKRKAKT